MTMPEIVSYAVSVTGSRDSCALPSGVVAGEGMVAAVIAAANDVTITGWDVQEAATTALDATRYLMLLTRTATGGDPDPAVASTSGTVENFGIVRITSVATSGFLDGIPPSNASNTTAPISVYTETAVADELVIMVGGTVDTWLDSVAFQAGSTRVILDSGDTDTVLAMGSYPMPSAGNTMLDIYNDSAMLVAIGGITLGISPYTPPPKIGGLMRTTSVAPIALNRATAPAPIVVTRTKGAI